MSIAIVSISIVSIAHVPPAAQAAASANIEAIYTA